MAAVALFDLDGTLLHTPRAIAKAMADSVQAVTVKLWRSSACHCWSSRKRWPRPSTIRALLRAYARHTWSVSRP
jgi:phosphoglycolate phosphatase-like HAD superfamily hydrolase